MDSGRTVPFDALGASVGVQTTPPKVEVRRSRRRTRTVSAYREGDAIVVMIPARLSKSEEREWVTTMVARIERAEARRRPTDEALSARAVQLSDQFLDGQAQPASVRWVSNQRSRWGSCTPTDRTIRLSDRLRDMPAYVIDYVLLHELTHLIVPGHDEEFWSLVGRFELAERARGYLEGVSAARQLAPHPTDPDTAGMADAVADAEQSESEGDL